MSSPRYFFVMLQPSLTMHTLLSSLELDTELTEFFTKHEVYTFADLQKLDATVLQGFKTKYHLMRELLRKINEHLQESCAEHLHVRREVKEVLMRMG
jgi:hypothetical protein